MEILYRRFVSAFYLFIFLQLALNNHSKAQTVDFQNVEINFNFSFSDKKLIIIYLIDPPDTKGTFEYELEASAIHEFSKIVLKPRGKHPLQFDGKKLSFEHNGNPYQKYSFSTEINMDKLTDERILTSTGSASQFVLNSSVFKRFIPVPLAYNAKYSVSVCADDFFLVSLKKYATFSDSKKKSTCLFATSTSVDELMKLTVTFGQKPLVALATDQKSNTSDQPAPYKIPSRNDSTMVVDSTVSTATVSVNNQRQTASEVDAPQSTISIDSVNFCASYILVDYMGKFSPDSGIYFPGFFVPFDSRWHLSSKTYENHIFCLINALESCEIKTYIYDMIHAYYFVLETIENQSNERVFLILKNAVEYQLKRHNVSKNRIFFVGLFYNIYYHYGKEVLKHKFNELLNYQKLDGKTIYSTLLSLSKLEFNPIDFSSEENYSPLLFSIKIMDSDVNRYSLAFSDSSRIILPGTVLEWILQLTDGSTDTLQMIRDRKSVQTVTFQTGADILYAYPLWEERILWPTVEIRPDFQALNELNSGKTIINRYRAYRTMISTGNPNLLATAISLALDDSVEIIRNFAFERLDEVPAYQVLKVKEGLINNIRKTDAIRRPRAYLNAERLGISIKRPALGEQKGLDLYADLMVLKQFEGTRAVDMALESFVEGNNDAGLLWFLAENGDNQIMDLLLTFEKGISVQTILLRICLVYQSRLFTGKLSLQKTIKEIKALEQKLLDSGYSTKEVVYIVNNSLINLQIFKASFTTCKG